ncbi:MAG: alpha-amylase family protein [Thermoguttaceae bacterium]
MRFRALAGAAWLAAVSLVACPTGSAAERLTAFPENHSTLTVLLEGQSYFDLALMGWEPNWKFMGLRGQMVEEGDGTLLASSAKTANGAEISVDMRVQKTGPRQLSIAAEVRTSRDTELLYLVAALTPAGEPFEKGRVAADPPAPEKELSLPLGKQGFGNTVRTIKLVDSQGRATRISFSRPCNVPTDGAARIVLAEGPLKADSPSKLLMTIDLPEDVAYLAGPSRIPAEPGFEDWYTFSPGDDHDAPSEISMQDWLEKPAGRQGRIVREREKLIYNGRPIKLWGLNLCYSACSPEKELADRRAAFYSKYGINAVRLHKFADGPGWSGIQSDESFTEFDSEGLDRMDYQVAAFKQRGIYVKLSAHFGAQKLGPADKKLIPYLEEFGQFTGGEKRVVTPHSAVHYSPELQQLQILQIVNLLRHRNPYTGLAYAEDPAVAFIEIINEQSILFYTSTAPLKASPTLRRYVAERFSGWLREKYGNQEKLFEAWGGKPAFDCFQDDGFASVGENLDQNNILPIGNPWYFDPQQLAGSQSFRRGRLLDTMWFLYQLQNEFYSRYVQAVRQAGYQGEIVASNWQAGRALSHFCNLHSDALVGTVDRHNYFGGGDGNRIQNSTMLAVPGSGTLSAGMQQVAERPFMLSEWIHVSPNEWGVEGPALVGAYGMGLQGWDVSYMFQNRDSGRFSQEVGRESWNVVAPNVLGVFPAVARQVLRGDVREAELLAPLRVHVPSLAEGKLGLDDSVAQQYDVKTFTSRQVPAASLALIRTAVEFTDNYGPTPEFDPKAYFHDGFYASATGQLRWKPGRSKLDGFFTINTDATQAVVGFAQGQNCDLGAATIRPECRYAAIYMTAREPDRSLADSSAILLVAIARARNTGMKIYADNRIIERGQGPVVMEPVKATIELRRQGNPTVHVLDHDGRKTGRTLPVSGGTLQIDGARDKTCYYLVAFPE